jgi:hypothetical protein
MRFRLDLFALSLALTLVVGASSGLVAQASSAVVVDARTRTELEAARDAIWRAWFANDTAALRRLIPNALAAGEGKNWDDRATTLAGARQFAASGGKLTNLSFSDTRISLQGSAAVVLSRFSYTIDNAGRKSTSTGLATEVFVKQDDRWVNPFWYLERR